jgi:putative hemolysin
MSRIAMSGQETDHRFEVRLGSCQDDIHAAQRLRYDVFVTELGADGPMVDHKERREADRFDTFADHLILRDLARAEGDRVIGTYRLMTREAARAAGQFYCADEYDLSLLLQSGLRLLELGRSCLHPDYRGGLGMQHLWAALGDYIEAQRIDVMFGVASFHGTDTAGLAQPLSYLAQRHLAPEYLRVRAKGSHAVPMEQVASDRIDRIAAVRGLPSLIKAYLRLGATVGDGAFVDHTFNTTDICLILEKSAIGAMQRAIYTRRGQA